MVFMVSPHDSQDVQNWHNLGAAHNQLRYQTLNNYLKDMRQMSEERYKEWVRVLNTLYQIYPHILQSQSQDAARNFDNLTGNFAKIFANWPIGIPSQQPIVIPQLQGQGPMVGLPPTPTPAPTTNPQQNNQQQSGQQTNQQNP